VQRPANPQPRSQQGKSKAETERQNQGNKPEAVAQKLHDIIIVMAVAAIAAMTPMPTAVRITTIADRRPPARCRKDRRFYRPRPPANISWLAEGAHPGAWVSSKAVLRKHYTEFPA
jgi:hypothetical protein